MNTTEKGPGSLEEPIEGLLATPPAPLPFLDYVDVRAFLLVREQGNVIVYNAPGIGMAADDIRARGWATRLLINHGHEAMYGAPDLEAPVYIGERDEAAIGGTFEVTGTFARREMLDGDLEVIPIPGHTPGSVAYLWDSGAHRFLFTGDSVWVDRGEWSAVVLADSDRGAYLDSLATLRDLDFDVLVPWGAARGDPIVEVVSRAEAEDRLAALMARVSAGSR